MRKNGRIGAAQPVTLQLAAAPADGTVKQIFVKNAQPVEFGEVLVVIE